MPLPVPFRVIPPSAPVAPSTGYPQALPTQPAARGRSSGADRENADNATL